MTTTTIISLFILPYLPWYTHTHIHTPTISGEGTTMVFVSYKTMTRRELRLRMVVALASFSQAGDTIIYIIFYSHFYNLPSSFVRAKRSFQPPLLTVIIRRNNETFIRTVFQSQRLIIIIVLIAPYCRIIIR